MADVKLNLNCLYCRESNQDMLDQKAIGKASYEVYCNVCGKTSYYHYPTKQALITNLEPDKQSG